MTSNWIELQTKHTNLSVMCMQLIAQSLQVARQTLDCRTQGAAHRALQKPALLTAFIDVPLRRCVSLLIVPHKRSCKAIATELKNLLNNSRQCATMWLPHLLAGDNK
jgi:hypothetical protein